MQIRPAAGDLLFCKAGNLSGYLICLVGGGPYSHVKIAVDATHCIESVPGGIRLQSIIGDETLVAMHRSADQLDAMQKLIPQWIGTSYGYGSYTADLLAYLGLPWISKLIQAKELKDREINCVQLAVILLNLPLSLSISPSQLYNLLQKEHKLDGYI